VIAIEATTADTAREVSHIRLALDASILEEEDISIKRLLYPDGIDTESSMSYFIFSHRPISALMLGCHGCRAATRGI
jgi:hypothetical protein